MLSGIKLNMEHACSAPVHCIIQSVVYGMVKYFSHLRDKRECRVFELSFEELFIYCYCVYRCSSIVKCCGSFHTR